MTTILFKTTQHSTIYLLLQVMFVPGTQTVNDAHHQQIMLLLLLLFWWGGDLLVSTLTLTSLSAKTFSSCVSDTIQHGPTQAI